MLPMPWPAVVITVARVIFQNRPVSVVSAAFGLSKIKTPVLYTHKMEEFLAGKLNCPEEGRRPPIRYDVYTRLVVRLLLQSARGKRERVFMAVVSTGDVVWAGAPQGTEEVSTSITQ